jgi:hypothetical protein
MAVADAIWSLTLVERIKNSPWDEAYLSEIRRIYRKAVPRHLHETLVTHCPIERGIYGVSLDGGPITALDRRVTEKEAQELAFEMANRRYFDAGEVVKEISLHRRGMWFPRWVLTGLQDWTPMGTGRYELTGIDDEGHSYVWMDRLLPTLFAKSKDTYQQVGILSDNVVEMGD